MGLEIIELAMAVEEEFNIELPDHDLEALSTPQKLADYIEKKLYAKSHSRCHSLATFNLLRRTLIEEFAFSRNEIKLKTKLEDLIPRENLKHNWHVLRQKLDISPQAWPKLVHPSWLCYTILIVSFLAPLFFCIAIWGFSFWWLLTSLLASLFILPALFNLATPLESQIPPYISTIKDLIPSTSTSSKLKFSESKFQKRIKEIIFDQIGIGEEHFWWDADWYEDLGCG